MSIYPFLAEEAENDVVFKFLKENKIDVVWDMSSSNYTKWNDIFYEGIRVMQIDQGITVDQFKNVLRILSKNIDATEFPDDGKDFTLTLGDIRIFKRFLKAHGNIFKV